MPPQARRAPAVTARVGRALAAIRPLPSVTSVSPLVTAADGHTALSTVQFDAISAKIPAGDIKAVIAKAQSHAGPARRWPGAEAAALDAHWRGMPATVFRRE
jgi:hypothetical protein